MAESVTFHHSIYAPESIASAAVAYAELLNIDVESDETSTTARFSDLDAEDGIMLVDAFCNHVLFETIERYRHSEAQT